MNFLHKVLHKGLHKDLHKGLFVFGLMPVCFLLFICFLLFSGCEKPDPRKEGLVPAAGTITYNGLPLEGATIVLMQKTQTEKQGAAALSDAGGKFELATISSRDGAYPGEYSVFVKKDEASTLSDEEILAYARQGKKEPAAKSLIPVKYTNPAKPVINITIPPAGDTNLLIELKD